MFLWHIWSGYEAVIFSGTIALICNCVWYIIIGAELTQQQICLPKPIWKRLLNLFNVEDKRKIYCERIDYLDQVLYKKTYFYTELYQNIHQNASIAPGCKKNI